LPASSSSTARDFFSQLFADENLARPLQEILCGLGLGKLDHFPEASLAPSLAVAKLAQRIFPAEVENWSKRTDALLALQEFGIAQRAKGLPLSSIIASRRLAGNPYGGLFERFPIAACITQDYDAQTQKWVQPFQALLLRAAIDPTLCQQEATLRSFADYLRFGRRFNHPINSLLKTIFEHLTISAVTPEIYWQEFADALPKIQAHTSWHQEALHFLRIAKTLSQDITHITRPISGHSAQPTPSSPSPFGALRARPENTKDTTEDEHSFLGPQATHIPSRRNDDENPDSPEHVENWVVQTTDTPADAANISTERERLELRYSNYNTALDNQILPHTWDSLSPVEIACLSHHLNQDLASGNITQAFWVAVLLITGQTFPIVHRMATCPDTAAEDRLGFEGRWHRKVRLPPDAFSPTQDQRAFLLASTAQFELQFPEIIRAHASIAINEVRTTDGSLSKLERRIRDYCSELRLQTGFRFLPGRIAAVLKPRIMGLTGDAVMAHLIAGRYTDVPPMGLFYSSYPATTLTQIYQRATQALLPEGN